MRIRALIPQRVINYLKHLPLAILALLFYRFPSRKLKVVGVTGTDGKTTTANLIYHILKEAGLSVALVSTVSAKIGEEEIDTGFHVTAPEPWLLQKLLKKMVGRQIDYTVLEVTSHGLDQFRLLGISFEVGVLTNITHEHLDYHKTFQNYLEAKAKLLLKAKVAILNKDDESYPVLKSKIKNKKGKVFSYGIKGEADFTPGSFPFKTKLPGRYNQSNCLAAIATAVTLGVPEKVIKEAVASFGGVEGRMEEIKKGPFRVIVDFAHTPNALEEVLGVLRGNLKLGSRLMVVFGAAGLRDREKRPMMGKIAGRMADLVILTAEDPRTERVEDICEEIAAGCRAVGVEPNIIPDREKAIRFAIGQAKKDDIIVICGKGHEKSMCFGKQEYPWSDREAVRKVLSREEQ